MVFPFLSPSLEGKCDLSLLSAATLSEVVTFNRGGGEVTEGQSAKQGGYLHRLLASVVDDNARVPLLPQSLNCFTNRAKTETFLDHLKVSCYTLLKGC